MGRRVVMAAVLSTALVLAGCGGGQDAILAAGCTEDDGSVVAALERAPDEVVLADGTRLSDCVANGLDDADLQNIGITYHRAAERLRDEAQEGGAGEQDAALRLGYLVGATRRGAAGTNGVMAELQRRIENVAGRYTDRATPAGRSALERGLAAGERLG